ncbi:MAG: hypothetical protein V4671_01175 [Armatimonadota bacterium]
MSDGKQDKKEDKNNHQESSNLPRSGAEWTSLIVALLLVLGVIGVIVALWIQDKGAPATFRVEKGAVRKAGNQYYLPVTVTNEGDATAAQVTVQGTLTGRNPNSSVDDEEATTTFDFVPAHAAADGVLIFRADPTEAEVQVTSYQLP